MKKPAATEKSLPKPDETPAEKPRKGAAMLAAAGAGVLIMLAAAASLAGGAVLAVGAPRLKEAMRIEPSPAHEESDAQTIPDYVALPETPYELLGGGKQGYLLASISFKTTQRETVERLMPEIRAVTQAYIRELSPADLKGATGLYRLKRDCLHRARKIAGAAAVEDVFITDIVIQ